MPFGILVPEPHTRPSGSLRLRGDFVPFVGDDRPLLQVQRNPGQLGLSPRKPHDSNFNFREALYSMLGVDLTAIEGIDELRALTLVSELGTDRGSPSPVRRDVRKGNGGEVRRADTSAFGETAMQSC